MKRLKIIADSKIPYLKGILEPYARISYYPPQEITADKVHDADILIIRTRTRCDKQLLGNSRCRFIGTATIGYAHIDTGYCQEHGITWQNAPGCNASSVGQYILSSLLLLSRHTGRSLQDMTIGIVGVGHVGSIVAKYCRIMGMKVLLNDPPRARKEGEKTFVPLSEIAKECDIITFHTPLILSGTDKTWHLADEKFLASLAKRPVIINSSRGEVTDNHALLHALDTRLISEVILDCWEHEPDINLELLTKAFIATPHIAGYSADGKSTATRMIVQAIGEKTGISIDTSAIKPPPPVYPDLSLSGPQALADAVIYTYNPNTESQKLKDHPELFEDFRNNYPLRREFNAYNIVHAPDHIKEKLLALGFSLPIKD